MAESELPLSVQKAIFESNPLRLSDKKTWEQQHAEDLYEKAQEAAQVIAAISYLCEAAAAEGDAFIVTKPLMLRLHQLAHAYEALVLKHQGDSMLAEAFRVAVRGDMSAE